MANKRKELKLRRGAKKILAAECGVSLYTVYLACRYNADTGTQNLVRKRARDLGLVRQF